MPKSQVYVAKGSSPWYNNNNFWVWMNRSHVVNIDESTSGQAIVTCDGNITNMKYMFGEECRSLTSINLSGFDTSNVTDMYHMFSDCNSLTTLDLSNFDTSKVENMIDMFSHCSSLTTIKGVIDMKSCKYCYNMFYNCSKLKGVKIKNPPSGFESKCGLSKSQYTIVDDKSDSLKRRNNMLRTTDIEPIDCIDAPINIYRAPGSSAGTISINYIPSDANNDAPKYDKATQEFDGKKEKDSKEAMSGFNKAVKDLSNKLNEIINKNIERSSPKKELISKETKAENHKLTNEEKVKKTINKQRPNSSKDGKLYHFLTEFIYDSYFIPAFLWFMEHSYNNVSFAHQHKRRSYKIYKEIIKGGNITGECIIDDYNTDNEFCDFILRGSDRALKDFIYNRQKKAAKLLARYIIASNTTSYVLSLKRYLECPEDCSLYVPTSASTVKKRSLSDVYVKTLEKVCFGKDF